jgi:hypothetical protein
MRKGPRVTAGALRSSDEPWWGCCDTVEFLGDVVETVPRLPQRLRQRRGDPRRNFHCPGRPPLDHSPVERILGRGGMPGPEDVGNDANPIVTGTESLPGPGQEFRCHGPSLR